MVQLVGNLIMDLVIDKEEGMHGFGSPELGEFIGMEGSIFIPPTYILREYIARDCGSMAAQIFILLKSQGESFCNDNVTSEVIKGLFRIVDWMGLSAERELATPGFLLFLFRKILFANTELRFTALPGHEAEAKIILSISRVRRVGVLNLQIYKFLAWEWLNSKGICALSSYLESD